mgnify:CR=1 FL=1
MKINARPDSVPGSPDPPRSYPGIHAPGVRRPWRGGPVPGLCRRHPVASTQGRGRGPRQRPDRGGGDGIRYGVRGGARPVLSASSKGRRGRCHRPVASKRAAVRSAEGFGVLVSGGVAALNHPLPTRIPPDGSTSESSGHHPDPRQQGQVPSSRSKAGPVPTQAPTQVWLRPRVEWQTDPPRIAGGIPAGSRWLSATTSPDPDSKDLVLPRQGYQPPRPAHPSRAWIWGQVMVSLGSRGDRSPPPR